MKIIQSQYETLSNFDHGVGQANYGHANWLYFGKLDPQDNILDKFYQDHLHCSDEVCQKQNGRPNKHT